MRWSFGFNNITPTAVADAAAIANGTYFGFIQGGNTVMRNEISEVFLSGETPATSSPTYNVLSRDSTVGATSISGGTLGNGDGAATTPGTVPNCGNSATTPPQRSNALHLLNLSCNAYGGVIRWTARPGEELSTVGQAVNSGEISLSARTGTGSTPGQFSGHIIFEQK